MQYYIIIKVKENNRDMNRLATSYRVRVIAALVEGASINATCRMTGVAKHTVLKLLKDLGCAAASYHNQNVRNLRVRRVLADEIWAFVGAKSAPSLSRFLRQGGDFHDSSPNDLQNRSLDLKMAGRNFWERTLRVTP